MSGLAETAKPLTEFASFDTLDIRVGRIVEASPFPRARNPSYKVAVDLGPLGIKWSSAQVTSYAIADLVGTDVACICNFASRNIAGFQSEVLILGARNASGDVILLSPRADVPHGSTVL